MENQRDEAFEEAYSKICKPIIARPYPRDANGEYVYEEIHEAYLMWQAKDQAMPYKSCSIKSHEIIINETKKELIDGYDIAKEDEYLLESLVYRGVCIGKTQVPEGFVMVPTESLKVALFWMNEDIDPWQMGGDSFADLFEHKPILEKIMIQAQEQSHDSQSS